MEVPDAEIQTKTLAEAAKKLTISVLEKNHSNVINVISSNADESTSDEVMEEKDENESKVVVVNDCKGHCNCIECTICLHCHTCDMCTICVRCDRCKVTETVQPLRSPSSEGTERPLTILGRLNVVRFGFHFQIHAEAPVSDSERDSIRQFHHDIVSLDKKVRPQTDKKFLGVVRLLPTDDQYWASVSVQGYLDIPIPRCAGHLVHLIPDLPNIDWYVVDKLGDQYKGFIQMGLYARRRIDASQRISIKITQHEFQKSTSSGSSTSQTCHQHKISVGDGAISENATFQTCHQHKNVPEIETTSQNCHQHKNKDESGPEKDRERPVVGNPDGDNDPPPPPGGGNGDAVPVGFPETPPFRLLQPEFRWPNWARNNGTPQLRQRRHRDSIIVVPMIRDHRTGRVPPSQYRAREENEEKTICGYG